MYALPNGTEREPKKGIQRREVAVLRERDALEKKPQDAERRIGGGRGILGGYVGYRSWGQAARPRIDASASDLGNFFNVRLLRPWFPLWG